MTAHIQHPDLIENPHAFLSRSDGVSTGIYRGLNCGSGSNDDPSLVAENRRIAASIISNRRDTPMLSLYQIHSAEVAVVEGDWGATRPKADAMVTRTPGIILGILTADCTPVLFEDAKAGVVGAAHAGWKGAFGGVIENALNAMVKLGSKPKDIVAVIGPTIAQASYEVDSGFRQKFINTSQGNSRFFTPGKDSEHFQFNLPAYVKNRLVNAGCGHVHDTAIDTYTSACHFSYRRTTHKDEPDYGRQLSGIMLRS